MTTRTLFFIVLGLLSNAYIQVLGNGIGNNNCLIGNGLAANGLANGFGNNCFGPNLTPNLAGPGLAGFQGGSVPVGYGNVALTGELPVTGSTAVAGQVPVIGYVNFEGYLPAGGLVSVAPSNCGCV